MVVEVDVFVVPALLVVAFEDEDTVCPLDESEDDESPVVDVETSELVLSESISSVELFTSRITFPESVLSPNLINDQAATTQPINRSARITPNIIFLACSLILFITRH